MIGLLFRMILFVVVAGALAAAAVVGGFFAYEWLLNPTTLVPNVIRLETEDAVEKLEGQGFSVLEIDERHDAVVPAGQIADQKPAPGQPVRQGRSVRLIRSLGPRREATPDLGNQSLERAIAMLRQRHLKEGIISRVPHLDVPAGHVVTQAPWPGIPIARANSVDLLVSSGVPSEYIAVPNIMGMNMAEAKQRITDEGLIVAPGFLYRVEPTMENRVVDQDPAPGAKIRLGDPIKLTIGCQHEQTSDTVRYVDLEYVIPAPEPPNKGYVEVQVMDSDALRTVYRDIHPQGVRLKWQQRLVGVAEILIYLDGELIQHDTQRP